MKVGYAWATSDDPQLWPRDLPPELQTVGVEHTFSCFMPVNLDRPMDGRENMLVSGSSYAVPYPCQQVSMSMLAGDLWILSSYVILRGGAVPRDAPHGSTCIIAFAAVAARRVDFTRPRCRSSCHPGLQPPRNNRRHLP